MSGVSPKHRWLRFSLRALLVLVAVAAIATGLWRRAQTLHRLSAEHRHQAHNYASGLRWDRKLPAGVDPAVMHEKRLRKKQQQALHRQWSQRYEQAIWRPWLHPAGDLPAARPF